jgi:endonuclease/exonuclease/phosphatase family metal-dependent hydrolase
LISKTSIIKHMKNIYSLRHLMAFLSFFYCCSEILFAQTMPQVKSLPYTEEFNGLGATYPSGIQGWNASTPTSSNLPTPSSFTTSGTIKSDQGLIASGSATSTTGGIYNFTGKIGFLNGGGFLDQAIALAINTTGSNGVQVQYDALVIRNPYGVSGSNRVNEMALQYRVGETGDFVTLSETLFQNNTTTRTSEAVASQTDHKKIMLPAGCDNQPIVQLRWITRQVSGGGSRPSFAIDNIDVRSDIIAPINITGYPKADNILGEGFDFSNKLNEIGKTYYILVAGGSAEPTIAQIKAGQDANGNPALQSGLLDITNASQVYVKTFNGLSLNTSYSVFSISEDPYGNIQSTVNKVDATTSNVPTPVISTTANSLNLGASQSNYESEALSYQIQAINLTNDVVLTSSANFTISKDNTTFGSSLTFTVAELASNSTPTVYVKFTPNTVNSFSGQITHETTGGTTKIVTLTGAGIDPFKQDFNDANVLTNSGWTQYNVAGTVNKWGYTNVVRNANSAPGAVLMNGFSDTGASKDWLISPKLRLNNFTQIPLLSFYSRKFYEGPSLKLMVSTNYDGVNNPENATWTEINGKFPTTTGIYVQSQNIDLSTFITDHTYIAWVYETTAGGTNFAAEWSFDDFKITDESSYLDANPVLDFGDVSPNAVSTSQSFAFKAKGYGDITITAPADYQLSLDNTTFQSSIIVTTADAATGKTLYARFTPSVKALTISGTLTVIGTSLNKQIGSFTGSSILKTDTFDIATYNLEFFGTDVIGTDGKEFGPTNDPLQIENVAKVMNKLNADVYAVQEVSNESALDVLIQKISINGKTFDKTISTSWSYSIEDPNSPTFPPQKLVVLYNTQTTTVKKTHVMFKKLYDDVAANNVTLDNYPGGDSKDFFSRGRLPYMVTIETNIGGIKKEINVIDLHARANSGTDISKYNMRKYDIEVLTDSLNTHYPNANFMLLGDFNDDVKKSVVGTNNPSTYASMVTDLSRFEPLTLGLSNAGANSYFNFTPESFLDHIIISNELSDEYIPNSIAVYDPRNDIQSYITTTSDHGPVIARFELKADNLATIDFENKNGYFVSAYPNPASDVVNIAVKTKDDKVLKLRLYDISGHLVTNPVEVKGTTENSTSVIQLSNLKTGIYVYTLSENNKVIYSNKIIKK